MKCKMIFSDFNPMTGKSKVVLATKYGTFTGYAQCHKDDEPSSFFGCELAEMRAFIKAMKFQLKMLKAEQKALKEAIAMYENSSEYNKNGVIERKNRKALNIKTCQIQKLQKNICNAELRVETLPQNRVKIINDNYKKKLEK